MRRTGDGIGQKLESTNPLLPVNFIPVGMTFGTLTEIAIKLVISSYILAVIVYVNATGAMDKDDDIGKRFSYRRLFCFFFVFH